MSEAVPGGRPGPAGGQIASLPDPSIRRAGTILYKKIDESSGIVASRRHPGVFWTHNDHGNAARIFAITGQGEALGEYFIDARNRDWEDIAIDDDGRLYIGAIGNNAGKRPEIDVLRIAEPDPRRGGGGKRARLPIETRWRLRYPAAPFDAEALFVLDGWGFITSKVPEGRPASLYRFPLENGDGGNVLRRSWTFRSDRPSRRRISRRTASGWPC